jgi:hypothetical protein
MMVKKNSGLLLMVAMVISWIASLTTLAADPAVNTANRSLVRGIKVLPDKAPDCSSLKSIVETVTRDCKTNDEKAIALYNFMRLTHYHRAYPSEPGGIPVLKEINCYGWSLCGGLHAEQSALWREIGWDWRFVGWPGHTTVEAFYDGRWHYLDVFLKFYAWMPDPRDPSKKTIAGQDDLAANPQALVLDAFVLDQARKVAYAKGNEFDLFGEKANAQAPAFLTCGDDLKGVVDGVKHRNRVGPEPGWAGMRHATGNYSADVNLAPGFALTSTWDKAEGAWYWADSKIAPCHTCGDKEIRNSPEKGPIAEPYLGPDWNAESYANGTLTFRADFSRASGADSFETIENATLKDGALIVADSSRPGRAVVRLQSPYLMTQAVGAAEGVDQFEISTDDGKSWKAADLKDFGRIVAGQVALLARFSFKERLRNVRLDVTVQNNPFALPYLSPGRNVVDVSVADAAALGDNQLVVTYAYRTGSRRKSYEQLCLEGKEIARAHDASWDSQPTVVQKTFSAKELPARFTIDVPTLKEAYPVFPRMLLVRREVVPKGQSALPLPEGAKAPIARPNDVLKSLPNPLMAGTQPPPTRSSKPVKTASINLPNGRFVDASGATPTTDFLKWPKTDKETVPSLAYVIAAELPQLPPLKELAAARLIVPVSRAHPNGSTKLGVVALRSSTVQGEHFDFKKLGDTLGTAIVPTLADNAPSWSPPKEIALDVTRYMKSIMIGETKHQGFALRVIPDRSVDEGWTVRVHVPPSPPVRIEFDTYLK